LRSWSGAAITALLIAGSLRLSQFWHLRSKWPLRFTGPGLEPRHAYRAPCRRGADSGPPSIVMAHADCPRPQSHGDQVVPISGTRFACRQIWLLTP
jgi:hypothetical protein